MVGGDRRGSLAGGGAEGIHNLVRLCFASLLLRTCIFAWSRLQKLPFLMTCRSQPMVMSQNSLAWYRWCSPTGPTVVLTQAQPCFEGPIQTANLPWHRGWLFTLGLCKASVMCAFQTPLRLRSPRQQLSFTCQQPGQSLLHSIFCLPQPQGVLIASNITPLWLDQQERICRASVAQRLLYNWHCLSRPSWAWFGKPTWRILNLLFDTRRLQCYYSTGKDLILTEIGHWSEKFVIVQLFWHLALLKSKKVEELARVFRDEYHFAVEVKLLNHEKPQQQMNLILSAFMLDYDNPDTLSIIYYAGHGVSMDGDKLVLLR